MNTERSVVFLTVLFTVLHSEFEVTYLLKPVFDAGNKGA